MKKKTHDMDVMFSFDNKLYKIDDIVAITYKVKGERIADTVVGRIIDIHGYAPNDFSIEIDISAEFKSRKEYIVGPEIINMKKLDN